MKQFRHPGSPALFTLCTSLLGLPGFVFGVDFDKEIRPILKEKCYKCHAGTRAKKGMDLADDEVLKKFIGEGKPEEHPIFPGNPDKSLMVEKVSLPPGDSDAMPPPGRGVKPMTEGEIDLLKRWIAEGAKLGASGVASTEETAPKPEMAKADPSKLLDWTNAAGKTIKAGFVKLDGENVVLRLESGTDVPYPLTQLNADSQKQAQDLAQP